MSAVASVYDWPAPLSAFDDVRSGPVPRDWDQVARVVADAERDGVSPSAMLADELCCDRKTAQTIVREWRSATGTAPDDARPLVLVGSHFARLFEPAPEWYAGAHCRTVAPAVMFPTDARELARAKQVCAGCPVRAECLEHALDRGEAHGVWGGESERARHRMRRDRPVTR